MHAALPQLTSQELEAWLTSADAPLVLDVREAGEVARGMIPGARHLPLGELAQRVAELPTDRPIVVVCHSGARSTAAARHLLGQGFAVRNLVGGMLGWPGPLERPPAP